MKKTRIMILAAVAMLMAACSSDDESQKQSSQPESGWSEVITVTAGTPGNNGGGSGSNGPLRVKVNTDDPQKSLWETGDQLTIWTMTGATCSTANMSVNGFTLIDGADTGTGKFSGRLKSESAPTNTTQLIAVIDNGSDAINASAGNSVSVDLSEQEGATAESALDYELYYADNATYATRNFTFTHKMALIKWTIKVNGASANDQCDIVLSGTGLKNSATLNPATGALTVGSTDGTITLKDVTLTSAASTELYVVLPPCQVSSGIKATLTMTDGKTAEGSLGVGAITVEENKYYIAGVNEFTLQAAHEYVDLGLSVKWATTNVGAASPEEYGLLFAWGETTGYSSVTDHIFDWANYQLCNGSMTTLTKYNNNSSYGTVDNKTVLESADDAATANWGSAWRMPKREEWQELADNCYWEWTTNYSGAAGYIVYKAKNAAHKGKMKDSSGNVYDISSGDEDASFDGSYSISDTHIFLPAAGFSDDTGPCDQESCGYYWSRELRSSSVYYAWYLYFDMGYVDAADGRDRCYGQPVRAVLAP